jgi:predicted transcriptional regulator
MSLFPESSMPSGGRAVLLSIKPKYADLIMAGTKTVELRRSWSAMDAGLMVIYSSMPVQRLVGIATIERVEIRDVEGLWQLACDHGGGLTKDELEGYFKGKKTAYGVMIRSVQLAESPVDPKTLFADFTPPQSFLYLSPSDYQRVRTAMFPSEFHS